MMSLRLIEESVGRVGLNRPDELEQRVFRHRPLDAEPAAAAGQRQVVPNRGGGLARADLQATTAIMVSQEEFEVSHRAHVPSRPSGRHARGVPADCHSHAARRYRCVPWAIGTSTLKKGPRARATRGIHGGLTGVRSMTQQTSQRQQPRYDPARTSSSTGERRPAHRRLGSATLRSRRGTPSHRASRSTAAAPRRASNPEGTACSARATRPRGRRARSNRVAETAEV